MGTSADGSWYPRTGDGQQDLADSVRVVNCTAREIELNYRQ
jgi:hypothetical protein